LPNDVDDALVVGEAFYVELAGGAVTGVEIDDEPKKRKSGERF